VSVDFIAPRCLFGWHYTLTPVQEVSVLLTSAIWIMDSTAVVLDFVTTPRILCSTIAGVALLCCVLYGGFRKDRRFLHAYCLLIPIYMFLLLFYVLPRDYSTIIAMQVPFMEQIYGEFSGPVTVILAVCSIVLFSTFSWLYAWNNSLKTYVKTCNCRNAMLAEDSDIDDHPYHRKSGASFL
jgi:hypothetical protein